MTALSVDRDTPQIKGEFYFYPMIASDIIYKGSIVVLDSSGNAEPGSTATGKMAVGRAEEYKDNSAGSATDKSIKVRTGVFRFGNGDVITKAHIGDTAWIVDDQTVSKASSGKSQAGIIVDVDSLGVWVLIRPEVTLGSTGLVAANNLSDVGTAATARSNLGLDTGDSPTFDDLTVAGAQTIAETLAITGLTTLTGGVTGDVVATGKFDGTNLYTDKVSISLAAMIDLVANPHELVAAQGANTIIEFVSIVFKLNFGSSQFTESADNLRIAYVDGSGKNVCAEIETTSSWLVAAADAYGTAVADSVALLTASAAEAVNKKLVLYNTSGDFAVGTGSTVDCWVTYRVHDVS